jgi:hypothetical protein
VEAASLPGVPKGRFVRRCGHETASLVDLPKFDFDLILNKQQNRSMHSFKRELAPCSR